MRSAYFVKTRANRLYSQIANLFIKQLSKRELIIRRYITNNGGQYRYKTRVDNLSRDDPVTSFSLVNVGQHENCLLNMRYQCWTG
jgi:hypothetical protein